MRKFNNELMTRWVRWICTNWYSLGMLFLFFALSVYKMYLDNADSDNTERSFVNLLHLTTLITMVVLAFKIFIGKDDKVENP